MKVDFEHPEDVRRRAAEDLGFSIKETGFPEAVDEKAADEKLPLAG